MAGGGGAAPQGKVTSLCSHWHLRSCSNSSIELSLLGKRLGKGLRESLPAGLKD